MPDALWVHELIGAEVVDARGIRVGVVEAVEANPASDLLVLTDGQLIPLRFVTDQRAGPIDRQPAAGPARAVTEADVREGLRIDVFTIFPDLVAPWTEASLIGKAGRARPARPEGPRPSRRGVRPPSLGGRQPVRRRCGHGSRARAGVRVRGGGRSRRGRCFLLGPGGRRFDQAWAVELAAATGFSLLCGRYEGVDQRVADHLVDGELSLGDFVLAGGEVAALVVIEAVARLVPGVMGNEQSAIDESFGDGLLEYPQYTRPAVFRGWEVPEVLRSRRPRSGARGGAGPRPWPGPSSAGRTCIEARGGLTEEDRRPAGRVRHRRTILSLSPSPRQEPRIMNPTDLVDRDSLRDDVPDFAPGDTLKVHVRVVEGNRERVQVFQGAVIRRQGSGVRETFTVRKLSFGVGVERTFPVHSPVIAKIEVVTRGDVRRAKLYYLRDRTGKAAKIKEKRASR